MESLSSSYDAKVAGGIRRDSGQEAVVERLDVLLQALRQPRDRLSRLVSRRPTPRGVYLWGDVGRGKSMLVDILMASLGEVRGRRIHFHSFMREIHRGLHTARAAGEEEPLVTAADRRIEGLDLLALDEVEITDIVDAMIVGRVFERMLEKGVAVVVTSNRAPSDLYRDGLKRDLFLPFVRLIETGLDIVHLDGERDYRRGGRSGGDLYFSPASGDVAQQVDFLWNAFPDDAEHCLALGPGMDVRRKGKAIRASFDALCRRPFAASDYLDLAQAARTIFIDDVPRLAERDRDAVRRFILLVDTLYDARCGLVIGAEAEPDNLYEAGDFATEFRRTISRLHEMGRSDWPGCGVEVR